MMNVTNEPREIIDLMKIGQSVADEYGIHPSLFLLKESPLRRDYDNAIKYLMSRRDEI